MSTVALTRTRRIAYWVTTSILAVETGVGGILDLARTQHVRMVVAHLGYPAYLLTILGLWKIPGAIVLLLPRFAAPEGMGLCRDLLRNDRGCRFACLLR
jgi:hypothetical protein